MIANLNIDRDLTGRYDFNIQPYVLDMENIFKKYITLPNDLAFVKGRTDPIYDKSELERYKSSNIKIYDTPQCPFIAPSIIKDILELHIVSSAQDSDSLYNNKILDTKSPIYSVNVKFNITDILLTILPKNIYYTENDISELLSIVNTIVKKFNDLISNNFRYIYSIDVSKEYFTVYRYITIGEYRYDECVYVKKIEKEYEHDLHGETLVNS